MITNNQKEFCVRNSRQAFLLTLVFVLISAIFLSTSHLQTVNAQTKPLTYSEITTALNSKLGGKSGLKSKTELINFLITQIRQRKVDKPLTPDREDILREAGATDELVEVIRQNSPSLSTASINQGSSLKTVTNSIGMEFVLIPNGSFLMGSPTSENGRKDDENKHRVTISKSFYLGKYEVTQARWKAIMGSSPIGMSELGQDFFGDNKPVVRVSWEETQDFIQKLNAKGNGKYRLPTEAEWEYAARAGSTTKYSFGDNENLLGDYAWFNDNSGGKPHEVGSKKPNAFGLYDMHGNVWEWVQDWYGNYPSSAQTNPMGVTNGSVRVNRGGCWYENAGNLRSANRDNFSALNRNYGLGFRLISE